MRCYERWRCGVAGATRVWHPLHMVISALRGVEGYNRERMFKAFRSALSVDIRLFLTDAPVQAHMTQALAANVELIKTIPPRLHESLRKRIAKRSWTNRSISSGYPNCWRRNTNPVGTTCGG